MNPLHLNFHEYVSIFEDLKTTKKLKEKWFYIFGKPGEIAKLKKK